MSQSCVRLLITLFTCLTASPVVLAQSQSPFQVGAQVATLRIGDGGSVNAGFGGRASFDLRPWISVEGEFNVFPNDNIETDSRILADFQLSHERRRLEAFFGPKVGRSGERFGWNA